MRWARLSATLLACGVLTMAAACGGETDDGSMSARSGLPEGFPTNDVPLVEGDIIKSGSFNNDDGDGWSITILAAESDHTAAFNEASDLLQGTGFTSLGAHDLLGNGGEGSFLLENFENDSWSVSVSHVLQPETGEVALIYVVVENN